ncbi:MAG: SIMPL domain-containing protein [Wenzhouxiangellaceae bacterium]|nr:SIMPL domain-containing protein [Wenzhouxiangellaceae bacterium]
MNIRCIPAMLIAGLASQLALAGSLPDGPYVSTSAAATFEAEPDFAVIEARFHTVEPSAESARAAVERAQRGLLDLLETFDDAVRAGRIESMEFGEHFDYDRERMKQVPAGWFGAFTYRIEVDDFDFLPRLHYALAGLEWDSLDNPRFEVDDREAAEREARQRALEKASGQARALAAAQGAELGAVWGIIYEPMHDLAGRLVDSVSVQAEFRSGRAEDRFAMPVEPRPVRFEARVGVVYTLQPAPPEAGAGTRAPSS